MPGFKACFSPGNTGGIRAAQSCLELSETMPGPGSRNCLNRVGPTGMGNWYIWIAVASIGVVLLATALLEQPGSAVAILDHTEEFELL